MRGWPVSIVKFLARWRGEHDLEANVPRTTLERRSLGAACGRASVSRHGVGKANASETVRVCFNDQQVFARATTPLGSAKPLAVS